MDNIINAARSLGKILQQDERYLNYHKAKDINDNDNQLQLLITKFESTRAELTEEIQSKEKDTLTIENLDKELKGTYNLIMNHPNMLEFSKNKNEIDELVAFVSQIITAAANGENPDAVEYFASCAGSCGDCSGCA